jgi:hypothetical protein
VTWRFQQHSGLLLDERKWATSELCLSFEIRGDSPPVAGGLSEGLCDTEHDDRGLHLDVVAELSWRAVESFSEWDIIVVAVLCECLVLKVVGLRGGCLQVKAMCGAVLGACLIVPMVPQCSFFSPVEYNEVSSPGVSYSGAKGISGVKASWRFCQL